MTHAYDKNGNPQHYVEAKNGSGLRDTTVRDMKANDWYPSVTGILGITDKPGLTQYFINQHLEAAWDSFPSITTDFSYEAWCKEVRQRAKQHSEQARDRGNLVHKALEDYFQDGTDDPEYHDIVFQVVELLEEKCGKQEWIPEKTAAHELGYGCMTDLHSPEWCLDFKTKAEWKPKKMGYKDPQACQLAANREALGLHKARCANVFIGPEGEIEWKEWKEEDLEWGWTHFCNLLRTYKFMKGFT